MRRRPDPDGAPSPAETVPAWLTRFAPADWPPAPLPGWATTEPRGRRDRLEFISRRRAWSDAGRAWLTEHGRPAGDWYVLVHPHSAPR